MPSTRDAALARIARNIREHGFHQYTVGGGDYPRFAYTIGMRERVGAELVMAGCLAYSADETHAILTTIHAQLERRADLEGVVTVGTHGAFRFLQALPSWTSPLLLGALDDYDVTEIEAYQVVPDDDHWTIDTPDMSRPWTAATEPIWTALHAAWPHTFPSSWEVMTNLEALRGAPVLEASRWEEAYWEVFAAGERSFENARAVPLGWLISHDPSLAPLTTFAIDESRRRTARHAPWTR